MQPDPLDARALDALLKWDIQAVYAVADELRPRLERAVSVRMDPRLRGRVSASDVLQETFVELGSRLPAYLEEPEEDTPERRRRMPFFLWLRFLALQKLQQAWRSHMGAGARDVRRERDLEGGTPGTDASALVLADALAASGATPSQFVAREEQRDRVVAALDELEPVDREVLVLRHFEGMRNKEVAAVLELSENGVSLRHVNALRKLRHVLERVGVTLSGASFTGADGTPPG